MKTKKKLYNTLADLLAARANCAASNNTTWHERHTDRIEQLVKEHMPSGSGFDSGTKIDLERSTAEKLVFHTEFHHMTEGYYDGWTTHTVTVRASLLFGITLTISGRNRNQIKDYIHEVFDNALRSEVELYPAAKEQTP